MNTLDIILGLLLGYGIYKGLKNGLFIEIASIIALIAAIFGAIHFSYITGDYLHEHLQWDKHYTNISAFIITFIAIILIVNFAGKFLTKIADFAMLGLVNKIAGGVFGALKVAIIVGAILVFFERLNSATNLITGETLEDSVLYEPVKEIGAFVFKAVLKEE